MPDGMLLGFVVVALLAVMVPGLDTMLMLRHAVLGGWRAGLLALLGINVGCLVWGSASIAGLTAVLTASHVAYEVVRIAGAAYLIWLGGSALWKSLRRKHSDELTAGAEPQPRSAFRAGLVTNLLNPKVGVFYMSLLPQFIPAGSVVWGAGLVAIHVTLGLLWMSGLLVMAAKLRAVFLRERVRRWLDRVTATVFVGLGIKLAVEAP